MLVDIKSRSRQKFDVNLTQAEWGLIPGGTTSMRLVAGVDPQTGVLGLREQTFRHPPVVTFAPGKVVPNLPEAILKNDQIARLVDRTKGRATLVVVKSHNGESS